MPEHWSGGKRNEDEVLTNAMVPGMGAWNAASDTPTWNPAVAVKEREEGVSVGCFWTDLVHGDCTATPQARRLVHGDCRATPQARRRKCAMVNAFIICENGKFSNKVRGLKIMSKVAAAKYCSIAAKTIAAKPLRNAFVDGVVHGTNQWSVQRCEHEWND